MLPWGTPIFAEKMFLLSNEMLLFFRSIFMDLIVLLDRGNFSRTFINKLMGILSNTYFQSTKAKVMSF